MTQAIIQTKKQEIAQARKRAKTVRYKAMNDPFAHPCCVACGFGYPPIVHLHHVQPLGETGKDTPDLVWLCPNCHAMVHEIIRIYYSKRRANNLQMRLSHLEYWLDRECSDERWKKLSEIAKKTVSKK